MTVAEYDHLLNRGPRLLGVPAVPLIALVAANLLPLVGVLAFGWDLRGVLLLYWAENVIVGLWAIVRMLRVAGLLAIPAILFFCVHYGIFTLVHLVFVYGLTQATDAAATPGVGFFPTADFFARITWWALAALFVSHGVSFVRNFIAGGEWRSSSIGTEMGRPYPRMIVMHIAIIAGAFAVAALGQPAALLAVLVVLKILFDTSAHIVEHRLAAKRPDTAP